MYRVPPRYTMYDCSPLAHVWHSAQLNVWPHPLFIYTSFNTQLKYHLIYEASLVKLTMVLLHSFPTPMAFLSLKLISFHSTLQYR